MDIDIEDLTTCPICFEQFVGPKKLCCDHTLCERCFNRIRKGPSIKCPKCNATSNVEYTRPDFRITQFIDALNKQAASLSLANQTPASGALPEVVEPGSVCELCLKSAVAYSCVECDDRMCEHCKVIHLRSRASKDHAVIPIELVQEQQEMASQLELQLTELSRKMELCENQMNVYEEVMSGLSRDETRLLETSGKLRRECAEQLQRYFASIEHSITTEISTSKNSFKRDVQRLKMTLANLKDSKRQLDDVSGVRANAIPAGETVESLLARSRQILCECTNLPQTAQVPNITLTANADWKASDAVRLLITQERKHLFVTSAHDAQAPSAAAVRYPHVGDKSTTRQRIGSEPGKKGISGRRSMSNGANAGRSRSPANPKSVTSASSRSPAEHLNIHYPTNNLRTVSPVASPPRLPSAPAEAAVTSPMCAGGEPAGALDALPTYLQATQIPAAWTPGGGDTGDTVLPSYDQAAASGVSRTYTPSFCD